MQTEVEPVNVPVAAYAAEVSLRAMRDWLDRGALPLLLPREAAGKWHRLAPADILRLAVFGKLLLHGFTMAEAAAIVMRHIDGHLASVAEVLGDIPWSLLSDRLHGYALHISREPGGIATSYDTLIARRGTKHRSAVLTIHVGVIARDARDRVREYLKTNGRPGVAAATGA